MRSTILGFPFCAKYLLGVQSEQQVVIKEVLQQSTRTCLHALPHLLACALLQETMLCFNSRLSDRMRQRLQTSLLLQPGFLLD